MSANNTNCPFQTSDSSDWLSWSMIHRSACVLFRWNEKLCALKWIIRCRLIRLKRCSRVTESGKTSPARYSFSCGGCAEVPSPFIRQISLLIANLPKVACVAFLILRGEDFTVYFTYFADCRPNREGLCPSRYSVGSNKRSREQTSKVSFKVFICEFLSWSLFDLLRYWYFGSFAPVFTYSLATLKVCGVLMRVNLVLNAGPAHTGKSTRKMDVTWYGWHPLSAQLPGKAATVTTSLLVICRTTFCAICFLETWLLVLCKNFGESLRLFLDRASHQN